MNRQEKIKGFSLIEILVVITIIGIITAIAFPLYRVYIVKMQVFKAYNIGAALSDSLMNQYLAKGYFPPSYYYGNVSRTYGQWYNVNDGTLSWINVSVSNTNGSPKVIAQVNPDPSVWQAMNGTSGGQNIFIWSWEENGIINTVCTDGHQSNSIPEEYLPYGCLIVSGDPSV